MGAKPDLDQVARALGVTSDDAAIERVSQGVALFDQIACSARWWRSRVRHDPECFDAITRLMFAAMDTSVALQAVRSRFVDRVILRG